MSDMLGDTLLSSHIRHFTCLWDLSAGFCCILAHLKFLIHTEFVIMTSKALPPLLCTYASFLYTIYFRHTGLLCLPSSKFLPVLGLLYWLTHLTGMFFAKILSQLSPFLIFILVLDVTSPGKLFLSIPLPCLLPTLPCPLASYFQSPCNVLITA